MNSNELFAREKKAARLALILFKARATAEDVVSATPAMWEMAAQAATEHFKEKVHPPNSQATVYAVLEQLNRLYAAEIEMDVEQKEVVEEQTSDVRAEGGFGSPFGNYKTAQQEADEAAAAERKTEDKWEESQEYAGNRCPPRE